MAEKILLIDGNSIMNRGFYGLPLLANKDGIHTNGLLGFFNILTKTLEQDHFDYLCVAFDMKAPTFRHKMFAEYKGTRKPAPVEFREQLPIIRELLKTMRIPYIEMEGYEADDILGTLAKRFEKEGLFVTLLSGDRDLLQIASDNITISIPKTSKGKTETFNYNTKDVLAEYGVSPLEFIEVKALQGDSSDNIPGVSKVGPKTATELIQKYKNLESIYEHIDEINKASLKENLINDKEQAFLSRTLATIEINAPVVLNLQDCCTVDFINEESLEALRKYELNSVIKKLESFDGAVAAGAIEDKKDEISFVSVNDMTEADEIFSKALKTKELGFYPVPGTGIALSFSENENYFINEIFFLTQEYFADAMRKVSEKEVFITTFDIKRSFDYIGEYKSGMDDCEILAYLLDPLRGDYSAVHVGERYLNRFPGSEKEIIADKILYSCLAARNSLLVCKELKKLVEETGMKELYENIEMPLSYVLFSMEKEGVLVNKNELELFSKKLSERIVELESSICEQAGEKFNINSPKQLGEILFEKMGLPGGKKTKSGYSTAADVLEKLAEEYSIVNDILEYRTLSKLKSTYSDGLQNYIESDGRIHTHFNQTITATGRISSSEPNLQNIPIRTELGRELRKVFYPKKDFVFVDADYSQIELRLMAHMSEDEKLIEAYKSNKDIHRATAAMVFKKSFDEVTDLDRRNAKAVNFGIIYGISSYGLSQGLSITAKEAKKYIEDYFVAYPGVKSYIDNCVAKAKETGFVSTLYGRIRPIPELKDSNFMRRSFGERVAMNAPLQGTAADIMKIAMINIFRRLKEETPESKLLIQVHDEVLVEAKIDELEKVKTIIYEEMTNAADLSVMLEADVKSGNNWYEAH